MASILIIDDEATLARNAARFLEKGGHGASVAGTGREGLRQFAELRPDAVVLDYRLPDMDGLAVIAAIRAKDMATLESLPPHWLESGSSEIRNWIVTAALARDLDLDWTVYIPAYRSPALTGTGPGGSPQLTVPSRSKAKTIMPPPSRA